ncbi:MAG: HemK2/MTQ2 family protein methyltransferase [Thermoplasmata archaeon]|jgi:release factor glutamine methyltransferase
MLYEPGEDTYLLMDCVEPKGKILEMGAGKGVISIYLYKKGYDVTAVDIDEESINYIKREVYGIKAFRSNLFENLDGKYDTIIFNPPYLPGDYDEDITIYGGENGSEIIKKFLSEAYNFLSEEGSIYIVMSSFNDIDNIISMFPQYSFEKICEIKLSFHYIYVYRIKKMKYE